MNDLQILTYSNNKNIMKSIFSALFILLFLFAFSCKEPNINTAKYTMDSYFSFFKQGKYDSLINFYVLGGNEDTLNAYKWADKLHKNVDTMGQFKGYDLVSINSVNDIGKKNYVVLTYKLLFQRGLQRHTFSLIEKQDKYYIYDHNIE